MRAGLDLNATRVVGVLGAAVGGMSPKPVTLAEGDTELPLIISLAGRRPEVGRAGLERCRLAPHEVCALFLPEVNDPPGQRIWAHGRHRLNASQAMLLVLERLREELGGIEALTVALPPYLQPKQAVALARLAEQARLPWLGSVSSPLALALAAHASDPWAGPAVIVDVDEHALSWSLVSANEERQLLLLVHSVSCSQAGLRRWRERMIDAIAERCIQLSRRDPRVIGEAEQQLWLQLDAALGSAAGEGERHLTIQVDGWYQVVPFEAKYFTPWRDALIKASLKGLNTLLGDAATHDPPRVVVLTSSVARLPGLREALRDHMAEGTTFLELSPRAAAQAAHQFADRFRSGKLPFGHIDSFTDWPVPQPHVESRFQAATGRLRILGLSP
ncbi:MAG: hypothetical protein NZ700_03550 [Gemmataceae bacterium]|nr:hypothetical protein [Gemmataceae bacterium]MDW8263993.1 hypothetical protein [Gemmataceae bacterium]